MNKVTAESESLWLVLSQRIASPTEFVEKLLEITRAVLLSS